MPTFNPMQVIVNRLSQQFGNQNPMMNNVIGMAQKNDVKGLEEFARNLAKEKGIDVEEYYNKAMNMFGVTK